MKKMRFLLLAMLGFSLAAGCGYFGGKSNVQNSAPGAAGGTGKPGGPFAKPEKPKFKIPVTVERVSRGRMYAYLQARGTVVPIKELELKPEMTGRIYYTKRWVEGDDVKKDEVLARMDDRELNRNIELAELAVETAKAEIEPASANLSQAYRDEAFKKAMFERGAISKYEYDQTVLNRIQRHNNYETAKKNIRTREMELQKIKQENEKVPILIPYEGVLLPAKQSVANSQKTTEETDLTLMNGQTVGSGTVLCRLANIDKVYIALDVPAKDLEDVRIDQQVEIEAYTKSQELFIGKVNDISTALNSSTRTYTVNVMVDNPNHELRPGMFAKARIITDERPDAVSIPREMVLLRNNRQVVFVVKEKPEEDEVKSATGEIKKPEEKPLEEPTKEPRQLAMAGGLEKVAVASDAVTEATDSTEAEEDLESLKDAAAAAKSNEEIPMIAEERVVTVGIENREKVEIVDGLREGDYLVVLGYETLTDGVDVNIAIRDPNAALPGAELLKKDAAAKNAKN